jgi:hypothetical protein
VPALLLVAGGVAYGVMTFIEVQEEEDRAARIAKLEVAAEVTGPGRPAGAKKPRDRIYRLRSSDMLRLTVQVPEQSLAAMTHAGLVVRDIDDSWVLGMAPLAAEGHAPLLPSLGATVARTGQTIEVLLPAEKLPATDYDMRLVVAPVAFDDATLREVTNHRGVDLPDSVEVVYVSRSVGVRVRNEADPLKQTVDPPADAPPPPAPIGEQP